MENIIDDGCTIFESAHLHFEKERSIFDGIMVIYNSEFTNNFILSTSFQGLNEPQFRIKSLHRELLSGARVAELRMRIRTATVKLT